MGKIRAPFYRIVVADSRTKRDGRVIEEIGTYNPKTEPSTIHVDSERAQHWLGVGAQPSQAVAAILKVTGDIGGTSTLKQPEPKADKAEAFEAALKDLHAEPKKSPTTEKSAPKAEESKAAAASKAEESKAEEPKDAEPKAEESKAEKSEDAEKSAPDEAAADKADD